MQMVPELTTYADATMAWLVFVDQMLLMLKGIATPAFGDVHADVHAPATCG